MTNANQSQSSIEASDRKIYRLNYQAPDYQIPHIQLDFMLDGANSKLMAKYEIEMRQKDTSLVLLGEDFITEMLKINGKPLSEADYKIEGNRLTIPNVPDKFTFETLVTLNPDGNTKLMGLYRSSGLYCTQCEAEGFRRITWSPDRPDISSRFLVRIKAKKMECPILLSNGNCIETNNSDAIWHEALFEDPFPKPSYLFALVAGDLEALQRQFKTKSGRLVNLAVWVKPGQTHLAEHALVSLEKSMAWDERRYDLEYDLDIFNIVAVDDFNFGAMENKSLNVFNAKYVLADPNLATDRDYETIEAIVAHEYFHNWTGNRVTCRDWFQLSLKEGLTVFRDQSFSSDMHDAGVQRIRQVSALRAHQFPEDQGPLAHPVRPDAYEEINNFYTATVYEKGAEVVRMLHTILGEAGFQKGMKLYFERHDGSAATCDDFLNAMADANKDSSLLHREQFRLWYGQFGTPEVKINWKLDPKSNILTVNFSQTCRHMPAGGDALLIPFKLGLLGRDGKELPLQWRKKGEEAWQKGKTKTCLLMIDQPEQSFEFANMIDFKLPSLNRNFSAPIKIIADFTIQELLFLIENDRDAVVRYDAMTQVIGSLILDQGELALSQEDYLNCFLKILTDNTCSPALRAELLTLPSERELMEHMTKIDVALIYKKRKDLIVKIAKTHFEALLSCYQAMRGNGDHANQSSVEKRQLANLVLGFIGADEAGRGKNILSYHYETADNMTDLISALAKLIEYGEEALYKNALQNFKARHDQVPSAMDKWFGLQAGSQRINTKSVEALMEDDSFSYANPNRVRAVLGAFAMNNLLNFHAEDGSGYEFMRKMIAKMDKTNPMVASRLVVAFGQWRRFDEKRQVKMQAALNSLLAEKQLSKDSLEIITKSLGK